MLDFVWKVRSLSLIGNHILAQNHIVFSYFLYDNNGLVSTTSYCRFFASLFRFTAHNILSPNPMSSSDIMPLNYLRTNVVWLLDNICFNLFCLCNYRIQLCYYSSFGCDFAHHLCTLHVLSGTMVTNALMTCKWVVVVDVRHNEPSTRGVHTYLNSSSRHVHFVVTVSLQLTNSLTKRENWKACDLKGYTLL